MPWTARKMTTWAPEPRKPETALETTMEKLKLPYLGHIMRRQGSLEKTLMLGKIGGGREREDQV